MYRYYLKSYKLHYVCFNCKKTFKQPLPIDLLERDGKLQRYYQLHYKDLTYEEQIEINNIEEIYFNREIKCPQCASLMVNLGLAFKAPQKSDIKKWEIIKSLYRIGFAFHACGCNKPDYIPKDKFQYHEYLEDKLRFYREQLKDIQQMDVCQFEDKSIPLNYWAGKIQLINEEIKRNKNGT